jgi:hypothetical protein
MEYGNIVYSHTPIQEVGRQHDAPDSFGSLQRQLHPDDSAYRSIYKQDTIQLPAVKLPSTKEVRQITHDIRAETDAVREKFMSEVQAQARKQNTASTTLQQRIDERKRVYDTLAQNKEPISANEAREIKETFTSPGLILKQQESLLTENVFMPNRVLQAEHSRQFKEGFRQWFEQQRYQEERRERVASDAHDKLRTNNVGSAYGAAPATSSQPASGGDSIANQLTNPHESDRLNKPRITYQIVSSVDRDKTLYSSANDMIINLSRRFTNVKRVKLISTEIPNTDILIRSDPNSALLAAGGIISKCGQILNEANNNIYWIDQADGTEPGNYDCVIYDAIITPGNYVSVVCSCNEVTLASAIETEVSMINRYIDGTAHQFIVTVNPQTNVAQIQSIQSTTLELNPIKTTAGTNLITVTQLTHNFSVGEYVTISGATTTGGVSASVINGKQQILSITDDTYTYRVPVIASSTGFGGSANVLAGQDKPIMLLASNIDTPYSSILGFPQQDSAQQIASAITYIERNPPNPTNPGAPTNPGDFPAQITAPNHGLMVGEQVVILGTDTIPSINGLQVVTSVVSPDVFEVGKIVKVVNNQTVTTQTVLGAIRQSLDKNVTEITTLTVAQQGSICTKFPHILDTTPPDNLVWLGNLVGGLTETLVDVNGVQTVDKIIDNNCFNIVGGVVYPGSFTGNAFIVNTTSTALQPITSIVPANNGRFTPVGSAPIYTGSDVPQYVIFTDTVTLPCVNAIITPETDTTSNCSNVVIKTRGENIWQSWTALYNLNVVGIYLKCGEGQYGDQGRLNIYSGIGTGGTLLATSDAAPMERDVCEGAYFCLSLALSPGQTYTFELQLITRLNQSCSLCVSSVPGQPLAPFGAGISDLGGDLHYEFVTYVSPGVQQVHYYSQTTGIFDLENPIFDVCYQSPNQSYLRSLDSQLRCIKNALPESTGIWTFQDPHGLAAGDNVFVRLDIPPYTDTRPYINPNVIGLQKVKTVIDSRRLDLTTPIVSSTYGSNLIINKKIQIAKTTDITPYTIVNLYPDSTGYLCTNLDICDPTRLPCQLCAGDHIIIRGNSGNIDPYTDLITFDTVTGNIVDNVYGCYDVGQIYSGTSKVCHDIFDIVLPHTDPIIAYVTVTGTLPLGTINVNSTVGFSNSGTLSIGGSTNHVTYTGITATTFTGCIGGSGTLVLGETVVEVKQYHINSAHTEISIISAIPTIEVVSTSGFSPLGGKLSINGSTDPVYYTGITATQFTGCTGDPSVWNVGATVVPYTLNLGEFARLDTGMHGIDGQNGIFNAACVFFDSANVTIYSNTNVLVYSGPSFIADGLCVKTKEPHCLNKGDAIYLSIGAPGCKTTTDTFDVAFLPEVDNLLGTVVPLDLKSFKLYDLPVVSGNIALAPTSHPASLPPYTPNPFNGIDTGQFYYHKICGTNFRPIDDFYQKSYYGMLEVPDHGFTANTTIFLGDITSTPFINGCDTACVINSNFLTLTSLGTSRAVDPMPFMTGPFFPPSLLIGDSAYNKSIEIPVLITDSQYDIAIKLQNALQLFSDTEITNLTLDPTFNLLSLGLLEAVGVGWTLLIANNIGLYSLNVFEGRDVNTDFIISTVIQGGTVTLPEVTSVTITTIATDLNISPITGLNYAPGEPARYFTLGATGVKNGATTIAGASIGVDLATSPATINVGTTALFPSSGTFRINQALVGETTITYTGTTATSFTGCIVNSGSTTFVMTGADLVFSAVFYEIYVYFPVVLTVTSGNVNGTYAGDFVQTPTGNCDTLIPVDITPANNGVLIAQNNFVGGECVYFLNDCNINNNIANDLRNNFFTVSTENLTTSQFSLNVPITTFGSIVGNGVQTCETLLFTTPGEYNITATASQYDIILAGAGGGSGLDFTNGSVTAGTGGAGGNVFGVIDTTYGEPIYIFVGGAGQSGKNNGSSKGGFNGGGDSGPQTGVGGGGGGGATDIRLNGKGLSDRVVVAGGGGGGTGAYRDSTVPDIAGVNGGDGGGLTGLDGAGSLGQFGVGGTQLAGGAGGIEPPGLPSYAGALGLGGGPPDGAGTIGATSFKFIGGGGGYYGGGSGATSLYDGSANGILGLYLGGGGGGSSLALPGTQTITGGGAASDTDGFAILRPRNIAIFKPKSGKTNFTFTVPSNATKLNIECLGSPGGNASPLVTYQGLGGNGGKAAASFFVGGSSVVQPGQKLNVLVGTQGAQGETLGLLIAPGGANGGGFGFAGGGGGGGASSVRLFNDILNNTPVSILTETNQTSLLIVAGGGGGGGGSNLSGYFNGGLGGGTNGGDAQGLVGSGATQFAGGDGGSSGDFIFGGKGSHVEGSAGGGAGYYGGGSGLDIGIYSGLGGGGGSSYIVPDELSVVPSSVVLETGNGSPLGAGNGCVIFTWDIAEDITIPVGHFIHTPCPSSCTPCGGQFVDLQLIERYTNGVFYSANDTNFPLGNIRVCTGVEANIFDPSVATCIMLTNDSYNTPNKVISVLQDAIAYAVPFPSPSPIISLTQFETNIVIHPNDLSVGGIPIGNNNVDTVSTNDLKYPGIKGLGWILATDCFKNPIVSITADSNGTYAPVIPGLKVGDSVYFDSQQPTQPPLTGVHIVNYVDVGNGSFPQFFSLGDIEIVDTGGPVMSGNIFAFRTPPLVGNTDALLPINAITANACPTDLTVTSHGYPLGSFINLYIVDSNTTPSINSVEGNVIVRDIITGVKVVSNNVLQLPTVDTFGNTLCDLTINNITNVIITQNNSRVSKQILSTNCGKAIIQPDPANNRTIIYCPDRPNIYTTTSVQIVQSVPNFLGVNTITCSSALPANWTNGTTVSISGQMLGSPYVQGEYKIFNVGPTNFDIITGSAPGATIGTGGFVTGPAFPTIPGHGLETGNLVKFEANTEPPIGQYLNKDDIANDDSYIWPVFDITVLDSTHFSIPFLVNKVLTNGTWCNNLINANVRDHGLKEGDIVFVYDSKCVGGLVEKDINTVHGAKIKNIPTNEELATRKIVHIVDKDNFQFPANYDAFPTARALGGGYQLCLSAKNHTLAEVAAGCKNYGFNAVQSNQNCLGDVQTYLNFSNLSYILMTSDALTIDDATPVLNTGQVDHVFAKIQLSQQPGNTMFNTFIGGERIFYEPISRLDHIDLQLYRPDNTLFDMRGQNYSFTLEIEEFQDRMRTANVSSRRGINDPGAVGSIGLVESTISRENPAQNLGPRLNPGAVATAIGLAGAAAQK